MNRADCDRYATLIVSRLLFGKGDDMKKDVSETIEGVALLSRVEAMLEVAEEMMKIGAVNGAKFVHGLAKKARTDVEAYRIKIGGFN